MLLYAFSMNPSESLAVWKTDSVAVHRLYISSNNVPSAFPLCLGILLNGYLISGSILDFKKFGMRVYMSVCMCVWCEHLYRPVGVLHCHFLPFSF